ncbi:MAG: DinB family protein [Candidatus Promineofilum sp.]|nr:DinB family protein [Promineifilum sp.]
MDTLESSISPRRATLLARLAAERSNLLQQLEGVGETALARDLVYEGWSLPAMLGHIAYWDAFAADRLAKLADGRRDDIQPLAVGEDTLDARNAALRQRFAALPFAQAVAMCQKERRGLLLALSRLSEDALFRRVRLRPGWQATPASWAGAPYVHDAQHSADLARWRANYPPNDLALRVIHRALLRPLLGLSRAEFLALAALIPSGEREARPIEGEWTLKQVLGHLSDYERLGVVALRQVAARREPAYERTIEEFEAFNAERGLVWAVLPWAEVWAQFIATRRALLEVALGLDNTALTQPFTAPWLSTTTACGYLLDMAGHEQEHADALRPVLGLPALPRRLNRGAA